MGKDLEKLKKEIHSILANGSFEKKVSIINQLREEIHKNSPFSSEPVDFVKWVKNDDVVANDYNPNKVAPPEMELLEVSIMNDGYTQPIVSWYNEDKTKTEVVDGFHRTRVGKESKVVKNRVNGYLPIVNIRKEQAGKNDRIASTIRHNRARGKHQVNAMSEIVIELKNRNWSNKRISKQLGMDEEEVLRLCQISGLEHLFSDKDFSNAWEADDQKEYEVLTDELSDDDINMYRTANTNDPTRIFHTYDKWECHKAGFYKNKKEGASDSEAKAKFVSIISDSKLFEILLEKVTSEWKFSCEHYLTNKAMNRIAWLGQAAVCYHSGIPSKYSGAWFDLSEEQKDTANDQALIALNKWLINYDLPELTLEEAISKGRQVEIY